jgi:hypothetical protein
MRALASVTAGLLAAVLLAQAGSGAPVRKSRTRSDAGPEFLGTDPPGRLRPAPPAPDAGPQAQADAGPDATQRQMTELRNRIDALERQIQQTQQQGQQLQDLNAQMRDLRQQVADAESRRIAEDQQRAARQQQVQSAIDSLYRAQAALAGGSSDIAGALDVAQSSFSGQAQRDVQAARMALQNRDLSAARAYLSSAISNAQSGR